MKKAQGLQTGIAIDTIISVAEKLNLKVKYESTGVKDSELGHEKHMWLEDNEGNTKGSYFYWKKNNIINNTEGLTYTDIDSKTSNISIKKITDVKEIYKKFKVRMPKSKVNKKSITNEKVDRWKEMHDKFIGACNQTYENLEYDEDFDRMESETPGFIDSFELFSETGFEDFWNRLDREMFQLKTWEPEDIENALFRVMDDFQYEGLYGFKTPGCIAFTLSFYFTFYLKIVYRWSNERIDLFWDILGDN